MSERELDLIESRSSFVRQLRERSAEIMRCEILNAQGNCVLYHEIVDGLLGLRTSSTDGLAFRTRRPVRPEAGFAAPSRIGTKRARG